MCGSAGTSAGDGGTIDGVGGGGSGGAGGSYQRCTTFLQITLTITLITKGGKKGAILNVMPLTQHTPSFI